MVLQHVPAPSNNRIDTTRLQQDPEYLLAAVCREFQKVDSYHRGLITSSAFSSALRQLGLSYGQPEVDDILQYCTITDDGYVHYKELLQALMPHEPRAKQSSLKTTIFPSNFEGEDASARASDVLYSGRDPYGPGRIEDIRKAFAAWERGRTSNDALKAQLRGIGVQVTDELERLLVVYEAARTLPFSKFIAALQIDSNDGRRARNAHGQPEAAPPAFVRGAGAATPQQHQRLETRFFAEMCQSAASRSDVGSTYADTIATEDLSHLPSLRQVMCDFVDGHIPGVTFRMQLQRFGVPMSAMLDKLIRTHECDNSVKFQDLARLMLRQDKQIDFGADNSYPPSGSVTPSGFGSAAPSARGARPGAVTPTPSSVAGRMFAPPARDSPAGSLRGGVLIDAQEDLRSTISGYSQASKAPSTAPFATQEGLLSRSHQVDQRQTQRASSSSRAQGNHGDIIGWNGGPVVKEVGTARPTRRHLTPQGSQPPTFLQWQEKERPTTSEASRPGRRLFGLQPTAGEKAPFGRMCDVGAPGTEAPDLRRPFGTDRDLSLRRPEDAGTDEYRAASSMRNMRRTAY